MVAHARHREPGDEDDGGDHAEQRERPAPPREPGDDADADDERDEARL